MMHLLPILALALSAAALPTSAHAGDIVTETAIVRVPASARSSATAGRALEARLASAAMKVCGAPPGSLAEVKRSSRKSQCWRDAYANAVAQFHDGQSATRLSSVTPNRRTGQP